MFAGAVHSIPGNRYGDLNQDNSFVFNGETSADGESGCWAVFDGHGVLGEYASRIAASTIELLLTGLDLVLLYYSFSFFLFSFF